MSALSHHLKDALRLTRQGRLGDALGLIKKGVGLQEGPARPADAPAQDEGAQAPPASPHALRDALLSGLRKAPFAQTGFPSEKTAHGLRPDLAEGGAYTWETHGEGEAAMRFRLFVPHQPPARPGVLVMLHGCTQDPDDFATGTRMNAHAAIHGLVVAYPEQPRGRNPQGCWNWFHPGHQGPGNGELGAMAGIISGLVERYSADPGQVFVAGLSAGGAAAANLAMAYPERIRGLGVHSGLPAGAATSLPGALKAMKQGAAGDGRLPVPTIVFHGGADRTVAAANAGHLVRQVTGDRDLAMRHTPAAVAGADRTIYTRSDGRAACEFWQVASGGHAWFGGSPEGSFTDQGALDASAEMVRFFREAVQ